MADSKLNKLTVIGAGVLGGQIAWQSAYKGKTVVVYDLYDEALDRCRAAQEQYALIYQQDLNASTSDIASTRDRLGFTSDLAEAVMEADLVIESAPEIPEVKTALYQDMAKSLPAATIIATNTSTLLPSEFADASGRPEKFCCLHFANLIWSMNLAEIMAHPGTSPETVLSVTQFAIEIGMVPVPLQKEHNAYVINTMLVPLLQAAQTLVTNGISTPETIDRTYMIMNRGCSMGPCGIIDVIGMKTCYDILAYWGNQNGDAQMLANAEYIKQHFINKEKMGLLSGQGYYSYPDPAYQVADFLDVPDISRAREFANLVNSS